MYVSNNFICFCSPFRKKRCFSSIIKRFLLEILVYTIKEIVVIKKKNICRATPAHFLELFYFLWLSVYDDGKLKSVIVVTIFYFTLQYSSLV